jgi:hypothetical protein
MRLIPLLFCDECLQNDFITESIWIQFFRIVGCSSAVFNMGSEQGHGRTEKGMRANGLTIGRGREL